MRILIIHNFYQDSGGEDLVYRQESELLARTEEVRLLEFRNRKGLRGFFQFVCYPFNLLAARKLQRHIDQFQPDIVHIHNLHYASGPLLIRTAKARGIPVVMTLHNYRLLCPSATLHHEGALFRDSLGRKFPWKAIRLGVWSHSSIKTFWLALTNYIHHLSGTWKQVDRYFVLTEFARKLFLASSLNIPDQRWQVKPNFMADRETDQEPPRPRSRDYLFVGRLSEEKGLRTLVEAFKTTHRPLRIAGDGPLMQELKTISLQHPHIQLLGSLSGQQIEEEMRHCQALIFPSEWYEGMPMTLLEAFSTGTPVIASRLGAMEAMIEEGVNGWFFQAAEPESLRQTLQRWEQLSREEQADIGRQAYQKYKQLYTASANQKLLLDTYRELVKK